MNSVGTIAPVHPAAARRARMRERVAGGSRCSWKWVCAASWAAFVLALPAEAAPALNRIQFNGQDLFLSGANLAWQAFADDIGPRTTTPNTAHFASVFDQIHASGGNSLRLWLHTTGRYTPAWNGSLVTGPGNGTIADLRTILDLAWERKVGLMLCLWSFDMLRTNNGATVTTRARDILTNAAYRQAYITNCLVPMVQALKEHPAIIAWEMFNEPEGMSNEFGWDFNHHVPMSAIQAFINQCSGAIHRTDPKAKVTNGSWSFYATTDVGAGNFNYYTDARLIAAGGDPDGHLDFYTVHYYDWAGTVRSPFHQPASYWGLTKPLVVAEFFPNPPACGLCGPTAYETLYQNGYAGALAWSWTDSSPADMLAQMAAVSGAHPQDVRIGDSYTPSVVLTTPLAGAILPTGAPVSIRADAADPDGTVAKVEFFAGTSKIGQDSTGPSPYEIAWENPPTGLHQLSAVVTDNSGHSNRSAVVTIRVGSPPASTRFEAEAATFSGAITVGNLAAASGGRYLDMRGSGTITWTVPGVPAAGSYDLRIGFNLAYDTPKAQYFVVNGGPQTSVTFSGAVGTWQTLTMPVTLRAGNNLIEMRYSWGWMYFDYVELPLGTANGAPTLTPLADQTVSAGMTLTVTNVATDPNVPPQALTFALVNGPTYASLDPASGVLTWRPRVSQANTTNAVTVRVTDNGTPSLSATQTFRITVPPLLPPVLSARHAGGGQIELTLDGPAGPDYIVLTGTRVSDWQVLLITNRPALPVRISQPVAAGATRFYRLQLGP